MGNTQHQDLFTRTANLKRQLLEKMQHRESTPLSRTASDPPSTATGTANPAENKPGTAASQPSPKPVALPAPAPSHQKLSASDSDLADFITSISSNTAASQESMAHAQHQNSAETAATTAPAADHHIMAVGQYRVPQVHSQQAPYHGRSSGSMQETPAHLAHEQARPAAHALQQIPVSGSWLGFIHNGTSQPSESSGAARDSRAPGMTNRPSGMSSGLSPSVAQNGPPGSSTPLGIVRPNPAVPSRGPGSPASNVRLSSEELRDLSDWLIHTNFYDYGYRQTFLSRRRRLAALEEERLKLLQEVEEETGRYGRMHIPAVGYMPSGSQANSPAMGPPFNTMHNGRTSPPGARPAPAFTQVATHTGPNAAMGSGSLDEASYSERPSMALRGDTLEQRQSAKRARPETENPFAQRDQQSDPQERPAKISRTEDEDRKPRTTWGETQTGAGAPPPAAAIATESPRETARMSSGYTVAAHGNAGTLPPAEPASSSASASAAPAVQPALRDGAKTPLRPHSPHLTTRLRQTPSDDKVKSENDETSSTWRVPRHTSTNHTSLGPSSPIDLGHRGDTKFFLIKPLNEKFVDDSMEDGVWSTTQSTGDILRNNYRTARNVILFFSVNKSRAFQGYARMASEPMPSLPRPKWMVRGKWMASPPFKVEWLNTSTMSNHFAHSNKNSYNENLPVTVGLDGQEIEDSSGRTLIHSMEVNKYKQGLKESPKGKPESGSRGGGGAKKGRAPERTWSKPHQHHADQGYGRSYSPDRDHR